MFEIIPLVNNVLLNSYKSQEAYDKAFLDTTINVCNIINEDKKNHFKFGNAQKLVNMILKYFYISTYNNDNMRKGFQYCHCPMDQQLLEKVWKNRNNLTHLGTRSTFLKSWGKEEFSVVNEKTFPCTLYSIPKSS